MDLSIIIVSWRVKDLLQGCLNSIYSRAQNLDFEVIVVDNNSGDGTIQMVGQNFPQVKLIPSQKNLGFSAGNNLGLKNAVGDYVLFLNPDTLVLDGSLKKSVDFLKNNPQAGVLGCQLLNPDLLAQPSVRKFPRLSDHLAMIFKFHHLFKLKKYLAFGFNYQATQAVDQVMGAYFLMPRVVIEKIGDWDENYYLWYDEVDYCQRVKKAGYQIYYFAGAKAVHFGGQSFSQIKGIKKHWIFCQSRLRYARLHQNFLTYIVILILTPFSLLFSLFGE